MADRRKIFVGIVILALVGLGLWPLTAAAQRNCAPGESGPNCAPYRAPLTPTPVNHATPTPAAQTVATVITREAIAAAPQATPTPPPVILLPETGESFLILLALLILGGVTLYTVGRVLQGAWRVIITLIVIVLTVITGLITIIT